MLAYPVLIRKLVARQDLAREETARMVAELLREDESGWRILAFSVAAQTKGETPQDARSNGRDFLRIAHGEERGPKRDLVALNSGVALYLTRRAGSIREGVEMSIARLESGEVAAKLTALVAAVGSPPALERARQEALDS